MTVDLTGISVAAIGGIFGAFIMRNVQHQGVQHGIPPL